MSIIGAENTAASGNGLPNHHLKQQLTAPSSMAPTPNAIVESCSDENEA